MDMSATYYICPKRELFCCSEKLDIGLVSFGDRYTCQIEGIGTVRIKLSDGIVRELRDVRYIPQLKENFISVGASEAQGLRGTFRDGVFKMFSSSLAILKGIQYNYVYYLKGSAVTENLTASKQLEGDFIKL